MVIPTEAGEWGGKRRPLYRESHQSLKVAEILVVSTLNLCGPNGAMAKKQKWLKTLVLFYQQIKPQFNPFHVTYNL